MMSRHNPLHSNGGFTLTNMVVGLAIAAIVMVGTMSLTQMMTRMKANVDVKAEASTFIDEVMQQAKKSANCSAKLASASNLVDASGATETPIQWGAYAEGSAMGNNGKIMKMRLQTKGNSIVVAGANKKAIAARLEIQIENTSTNPPMLLRPRYVPMQVEYNTATNAISGCSVLDNEAQVCQQLGSVWDPTAPPGLECVPTDRCLYGGSYSSAPIGGNDGSGVPNPGFTNTFTGGQSCPANFSAQQTGTVSVASVPGKYTVVHQNYGVYTCVRCQVPVPNQANANPLSTTSVDETGQGDMDAQSSANDSGSFYNNITSIKQSLGI